MFLDAGRKCRTSSGVAVSGERLNQAANRLQLWMWLRCGGELARSHIFDHTLTQRTDSVSLVHGELHPGEVDDTSILRTGLSNGYWGPLDWLPISRLLLPRSGLERSDFVPWPKAAD
jgi:hypothetical protein